MDKRYPESPASAALLGEGACIQRRKLLDYRRGVLCPWAEAVPSGLVSEPSEIAPRAPFPPTPWAPGSTVTSPGKEVLKVAGGETDHSERILPTVG